MEGFMNGGYFGSRGYISQAVAAMLECLDNTEWTDIKLEPSEKNKVDFVLYRDGKAIHSVQVKSSIRTFGKRAVQDWMEGVCSDAPEGTHGLILIGEKYTASAEVFIREINKSNDESIKTLRMDTESLIQQANGALLEYVKMEFPDASFTADAIFAIYDRLFSVLMKNSIQPVRYSRTEFRNVINRTLRLYLVLGNGGFSEEHTIKEQIWNAMKKHFVRMKSAGGRFSFDIIPSILPSGKQVEYQFTPKARLANNEIVPLKKLVGQDTEHIAVIGTGGIGKTTYLQSVLEESFLQQENYVNTVSVPLFIELYHCPVNLERWINEMSGRSNFITRSIAAICENHHSLDNVSNGTIVAIEKELQKVPEGGKPEYTLLLDGFNEVSIRYGSETRIQLGREIEMMSEWHNVRIIATSRETEYAYFAANFRNVYLIGLNDQEIREFLQDTGMFSSAQTGVIMADKRLLECIRIPLYLLMYTSVGEKKGFDPQTPGEILYAFFHRSSGFYNLRSRAKATNTYGMDNEELYAILNFILPYIGWTMDEADTFYLSNREIKECYEKALSESKLLLSDINRDKVCLLNSEIDTAKQIKLLTSLQSGSMFEKSLSCIQNFFGLLYYSRNDVNNTKESREYAFVHHQFRDYFSAIWNRILLRALPFLKSGPELTDKYLNSSAWQEQKIHMLSEILMEHRNKSCFDEVNRVWKNPEKRYEEQSIAMNALNCLRTSVRDQKYMTSNLLRVVLDGRGELAGMDLGELDLEKFSLNGILCSKGLSKTTRLSAGFYGAHISEQTLETADHRDRVIDIIYRTNYCYTFDCCGAIKCWDIRSGVLVDGWQSEIPDYYSFSTYGYLKVSPNGRFLAAQIQLPEYSCVKLIDTDGEHEQGLIIHTDENRTLETMAFSGDSHNLLMLDGAGKVYSYNCDKQKMEWKMKISDLFRMTRVYQETTDGKVWLFTADYNFEDCNSMSLWKGDEEEIDQAVGEEIEDGVFCKIMTLDPKNGKTEFQREFRGSPGTTPAACYMPMRESVLYYDGNRGALMIGVGKEDAWEVFGEITAHHDDETMTLFRHPDNHELFYIIYPDEIYLVNINNRYYCSIISRYQANAVNALAKSRGQENNLVFCSVVAPSKRYFVLMNEEGIYYEWDEKENTVRRKYNSFLNECVGLTEDRTGKQYILIHRNNSICFFDSITDQLKGAVNLYDMDHEIGLYHFMETERALIITLVRLDNEKVIALNVDTGLSTLLFSTTHDNETVETIDSDEKSGKLLLTTQYRCCEIDLHSLDEKEIALSADNRRFISGQYGDDILKIVELVDTSDSEIEAPICYIYSKNGSSYSLEEKRIVKELPPEMYPYFISENNDLGMEGTRDANGIQRFWITEGFFLKLPEDIAEAECEMPLRPYEKDFVWHRYELRHYGEYRDGDIRVISRNEEGTLFIRNSRTLYFANNIHELTYEELDKALDEERGYLGGNSFWSYVIRLENGNLICNYEGDGLMRVDSNTGEMIREISYLPGLALWGCNFRGVDASDEVKRVLRENGAIVSG